MKSPCHAGGVALFCPVLRPSPGPLRREARTPSGENPLTGGTSLPSCLAARNRLLSARHLMYLPAEPPTRCAEVSSVSGGVCAHGGHCTPSFSDAAVVMTSSERRERE